MQHFTRRRPEFETGLVDGEAAQLTQLGDAVSLKVSGLPMPSNFAHSAQMSIYASTVLFSAEKHGFSLKHMLNIFFVKYESFKNCLGWGVSKQHFACVSHARQELAYGRCFMHLVLGFVERIPVVGQIVSLVERCFVHFLSHPSIHRDQTKIENEATFNHMHSKLKKLEEVGSTRKFVYLTQSAIEKQGGICLTPCEGVRYVGIAAVKQNSMYVLHICPGGGYGEFSEDYFSKWMPTAIQNMCKRNIDPSGFVIDGRHPRSTLDNFKAWQNKINCSHLITKPKDSQGVIATQPIVQASRWGEIDLLVNGKIENFKHDVVILPSSREGNNGVMKWNWNEVLVTGESMHHKPGVRREDIDHWIVEKGAGEALPDIVILTEGRGHGGQLNSSGPGILQIQKSATERLKELSIPVIVMKTEPAIAKYNELCNQGKRVAALIHLTC